MSHKIKTLVLAVSAISTMICASTYAAGFQVNELSPELQGSALAGASSSSGDITAMYLNPASLAGITSNEIYLGGSYIDPKISMSNASATRTTDGTTTNISGSTQDGNIAKGALVPDLYAAWKINDKVAAGLSIGAPWGLTTTYDNDWVGRYQAVDSEIKSIAITPTIAFKANDQWSFGLGVSAVRTSVLLSQSMQIVNVSATQPSQVSGHDWGYGYLLGVQYKPTQSTTLGLSYRSHIENTIDGTVDINISPSPTAISRDANAALTLPAVWNLGLTQQITSKWKVMANAQYTEWSSIDTIEVNIPSLPTMGINESLHYKNSWLFSLGTAYDLTSRWQLRTGLAFDQTPTVTEERDARIPGSNRIWATIGVGYHINKNFSVDAVYERIFMRDQAINKTTTESSTPVAVDNVKADYSGYANIFGLGVSWKF
ncbi:OmpP1/FadL family transporter [Piscirickettsia litoralis]|uniref:Uncharacterized protein n=1 Tax=Piscirickettsia litoralis TaxID=1891921 RepID=A0ABX3A8F4_9GAMM|nr:outer membrane protein transport protein [Piscirickettsia litoralis]ODN42404.1 hypothetical protein BGC07_04985 [Piscirickettsia litoralis]